MSSKQCYLHDRGALKEMESVDVPSHAIRGRDLDQLHAVLHEHLNHACNTQSHLLYIDDCIPPFAVHTKQNDRYYSRFCSKEIR